MLNRSSDRKLFPVPGAAPVPRQLLDLPAVPDPDFDDVYIVMRPPQLLAMAAVRQLG